MTPGSSNQSREKSHAFLIYNLTAVESTTIPKSKDFNKRNKQQIMTRKRIVGRDWIVMFCYN